MSRSRYIYPGGFARHIATILGFPSKASLAAEYYESACQEIASLAAAISEFEPVRLYAQPTDVVKAQSTIGPAVKQSSGNINNIAVISFPTNHLWVRDTGPIYVRGTDKANRKSRFAINFGFTEWGHKAGANDHLSATNRLQWPTMNRTQLQENVDFAKKVIEWDISPSPVTRIESKVCLEGGAVVVDGEGTLLATESSILNDNRNPGLSRDEVEMELRHLLGAEKIIWFPGKQGLDPTDVHVDAEVNFIRPGVIVLSRPYRNAPKAWWQVHSEIRAILERSIDAKGRRFEIHIIDEPEPKCLGSLSYDDPATNYVNFYFVNGGLIVPQFGDVSQDRGALDLFKKLCPDRIVRPVHVRALPFFGGVIHCSTQQVIDVDSFL
ncbi:porphyromonas-type peptidyl-arginine deiminase superfamily [Bisporella sp. PMI_857]|nr:porphyromonas-type peptidyl-arginine deiminase superfamily [Bisporella sp. PMI_857]